MQRRTNLPLLLSTLLVLGAPLTGCGDGSGGGDTGGGGNTGGGNTGGGGNDTGGGGTDTGGGGTDTGAGGAGGTTDTSGLAVCEAPSELVRGCIAGAGFPTPESEGSFVFGDSGVVIAVRASAADEPCAVTTNSIGNGPPETMLDLTMTDGSALTVGIRAPGFDPTSIEVGDTLEVAYQWEKEPAGFAYGIRKGIEIKRDGGLVAAVGNNAPAVFTPGEGDEVCRTEGGICKLHYMDMKIAANDGTTTSIAPEQSAEVDGLLVTNDSYFKYYSEGNCNFSFSVEYLMSAVAQ